jgi:hypothetical protein
MSLSFPLSRIQAKDIYLLLRSFVPSSGVIRSVSLYMSEFGKQMIEKDVTYGPKHVLHAIEKLKKGGEQKTANSASAAERLVAPAGKAAAGADSTEESDEVPDDADSDGEAGAASDEGDLLSHFKDEQTLQEEKLAEMEQLREYEAAKLRFFYAIVDCDSAETAARLWRDCNQVEVMHTGNSLDLRVVSDSEVFDDEPVSAFLLSLHLLSLCGFCFLFPSSPPPPLSLLLDFCRESFGVEDEQRLHGEKYHPPSYRSQALSSTHVESTWDRPDTERQKVSTCPLFCSCYSPPSTCHSSSSPSSC